MTTSTSRPATAASTASAARPEPREAEQLAQRPLRVARARHRFLWRRAEPRERDVLEGDRHRTSDDTAAPGGQSPACGDSLLIRCEGVARGTSTAAGYGSEGFGRDEGALRPLRYAALREVDEMHRMGAERRRQASKEAAKSTRCTPKRPASFNAEVGARRDDPRRRATTSAGARAHPATPTRTSGSAVLERVLALPRSRALERVLAGEAGVAVGRRASRPSPRTPREATGTPASPPPARRRPRPPCARGRSSPRASTCRSRSDTAGGSVGRRSACGPGTLPLPQHRTIWRVVLPRTIESSTTTNRRPPTTPAAG